MIQTALKRCNIDVDSLDFYWMLIMWNEFVLAEVRYTYNNKQITNIIILLGKADAIICCVRLNMQQVEKREKEPFVKSRPKLIPRYFYRFDTNKSLKHANRSS